MRKIAAISLVVLSSLSLNAGAMAQAAAGWTPQTQAQAVDLVKQLAGCSIRVPPNCLELVQQIRALEIAATGTAGRLTFQAAQVAVADYAANGIVPPAAISSQLAAISVEAAATAGDTDVACEINSASPNDACFV